MLEFARLLRVVLCCVVLCCDGLCLFADFLFRILIVPNCLCDYRHFDALDADAPLSPPSADGLLMEDATDASKAIHTINLQRPLLSDPSPQQNGQRYSDQY